MKNQLTILGRWVWGSFLALVALFTLASVLGLMGCATKEEVWHRVCYEKTLGRTDDGLLAVHHVCVTPEDFAAAQR